MQPRILFATMKNDVKLENDWTKTGQNVLSFAYQFVGSTMFC